MAQPDEIQIQLDELDTRLDRLRATYEQYFVGIEKLEPLIQKKDIERRFQALRKIQLRNTAARFRFQSLLQKYTTYLTYWSRICRQIEEGTFKRDLVRAQRYGRKAPVANASDDAEPVHELGADALEDASLDDGASAYDSEEHDTIPPPPRPEGVHVGGGMVEEIPTFDAIPPVAAPMPARSMPAPAASRANPTPASAIDVNRGRSIPAPTQPGRPITAAPSLAAPRAPSLSPPTDTRAQPTSPIAPAPAATPAIPPPAATPAIPMPASAAPAASGAVPPQAATPAIAPPPTRPGPPTPAAGAAPAARRAGFSPFGGPIAGAAKPNTGAHKVAPPVEDKPAAVPVASPAAARPAPQMSQPPPPRVAAEDDTSIRQLYERYRDTRRQNGEVEVPYETVAKQVRDSLPRLAEKYPGQQVTLDVSVKDGKTILKPVVRIKK